VENRPHEGGRSVVVRHTPDGQTRDVTPAPFNVRTRVHEYGGGAFTVAGGIVYFSDFRDQRWYRTDGTGSPEALTRGGGARFANPVVDRSRHRLIGVLEDHGGGGAEPVNALAAVDTDASTEVAVLSSGHDFYASPALSPDGAWLAWLTWDHPNMPWDGTELWLARLDPAGVPVKATRIAGGAGESVFQPAWSADGVLHFVSDRTGWWNLYRHRSDRVEALLPMAADFGQAQWVFGLSTYAFERPGRLWCACTSMGRWQLLRLDTETGAWERLDAPLTEIGYLRANPTHAVLVGGAPDKPASVVRVTAEGSGFESLRRSVDVPIAPGYLSTPEAIDFPTLGGERAYGLLYRPRNPEYAAPDGTRPPLLVKCHGGPTAAAQTTLDLRIQFWTSRGVAVLEVNYGGSTGYGRSYRRRLDGGWGVVDVADCVAGARYLVDRGDVDAARLAIAGGSAGGYTALCAVTFHDVFAAAASHYGIGDLEALALDTHKFEARYLDRLVGPYPAAKETYRARSPLYHADRLRCPVIFFQGLDDKVVLPAQSEAMVAALRTRGIPVAYVAFPGEQHGFRRAETIQRVLDAELDFYARVLGFELPDPVEPAPIENLPPRSRA
jgi:dipeptidyl aminopeptidase/acylaminoacyl peptidase